MFKDWALVNDSITNGNCQCRRKLRKLSILLLAVLFFSNFKMVLAEDPGASIFPPKGSVTTKIFLQIRASYMLDGVLYLYWDGLPLLQRIPQTNDFGVIKYDISFYPPTDSPYSDNGEHIIKIEVFYQVEVEEPRLHREGRDYSANLIFVIEDETSNGDLSSDYAELQDQYSNLLDEYSELQQDYLISQELVIEVQDQYSNLLDEYSELHQEYLVSQDLVAELEFRVTELESELAAKSDRQIPGFPFASIAIGVILAIILLSFWKRIH